MDEQLTRDKFLRDQQQVIHNGLMVDNPTWGQWFTNWRNTGQVNTRFKEMDALRIAEINRLFTERYENARNPPNLPLKMKIQMKQTAYETKKTIG